MKYVLVILLSFVAAAAQAQDIQQVMTTMKEFHQAMIKKNTAVLKKGTDEALSYGHSNGWVQSKADFIKDFETGLISYQSITEDSLSFSINDNMANVRFASDVNATLRGATITIHLKVLEVWVRKGSRWVLFARQAVK